MSKSSCVFRAIRTMWHGGICISICMSHQLGGGGGGLAPEFPTVVSTSVFSSGRVLVVVLAELAELNLPEPDG